MAEVKRGYAMLIQGGDAEISGALVGGMMAARSGVESEDVRVESEDVRVESEEWRVEIGRRKRRMRGGKAAAAGTSSDSAGALPPSFKQGIAHASRARDGEGKGEAISSGALDRMDASLSLRHPMKGKALSGEQIEVVKAEIGRKRTALEAEKRRRDKLEERQRMLQSISEQVHDAPVDYAGLEFDAELKYGEKLYDKSTADRIVDALEVACAVVMLGILRLCGRWKE